MGPIFEWKTRLPDLRIGLISRLEDHQQSFSKQILSREKLLKTIHLSQTTCSENLNDQLCLSLENEQPEIRDAGLTGQKFSRSVDFLG